MIRQNRLVDEREKVKVSETIVSKMLYRSTQCTSIG